MEGKQNIKMSALLKVVLPCGLSPVIYALTKHQRSRFHRYKNLLPGKMSLKSCQER